MSGVAQASKPSGLAPSWLVGALLVGGIVGAGISYAMIAGPGGSGAAKGTVATASGKEKAGGEQAEGGSHAADPPGVVRLSEDKWKNAGIEIAPARREKLALSKWVTGRLAPNQDRLAHTFSLVEGVVHSVRVQYGQQVKTNDVLAVIDSREVGRAKLALVKDRQDVRIAEVNLGWSLKIRDNVQALIRSLEKGISAQQIAQSFLDRAMGEYREKLVSAYANWHRARADFERQEDLYQKRVVSERDYLKTKAEYEAAQATYDALREQIKFTSEQQLLQAQQALQGAKVSEGASRSALVIMGYTLKEVETMDPLAEGEEVAHYTVKAPFDGTITSKDVALDERVGTDTKIFDLADLSTVWVQADIFERDLPALAGLRGQGQTIAFRADAYPDRRFEAKVFYTGDIVQEKTRTVRMTAAAENPDRLLKPGMFVEVELPIGAATDVLTVPASALQQHEGKTFVFVRRGGDEFQRRDVTVGRTNEQSAEIIAGLKPDEPVAVRGGFALKTEMLRDQLGED